MDPGTMRPGPVDLDPRFRGCAVSRRAIVGGDVSIGYGSVVHDEVEIQDGSVIQEHCVIGAPTRRAMQRLVIPRNSVIRSHTVIYQGSQFGPALETGHHALIREGTIAGENLRIGSFSDIEGDCWIGDYCRFHGYVQVGQGTKIGNFVWLFSLTIAANDPLPPCALRRPVEIGDGAVVCVGATLLPGSRIGKGAYISAGALAGGDVRPGAVVGPGGDVVSHVTRLFDLASGLRHPWMRHNRDIYPESAHDRIDALYQEVVQSKPGFKT